jgi:hypothetical protein
MMNSNAKGIVISEGRAARLSHRNPRQAEMRFNMSNESERFIDDASAIGTGNNFATILQVNSPRAMGANKIGSGGDVCIPGPNGVKVYSTPPGFTIQVVHGQTFWVIWPSARSEGKSGPIDTCFGKPPEARWLPDPQRSGKQALLMPGGAKVRETVYISAVVDGVPTVLIFGAPEHKEGANLYNAARDIRLDVDGSGDLTGCVGAKFRITTDLAHGSEGGPYYAYRWRLAGVLGQPDGPTAEEAKAAKALRAAAVREERRGAQAWKIEEQARKAALLNAPRPVIEHRPMGMPPGPRPTITSGPQMHWMDPRLSGRDRQEPPPPPPPDRYDGPDDGLDDLPNFGAPQRR